jgi:hypothetical protein
MLTSHDGKLDVDLVAAPATYTIGGHRFEGMLYKGQYMPPVWRLRAGDILTVTLHNQLSEETNLHFHGLKRFSFEQRRQCVPSHRSQTDIHVSDKDSRETHWAVLVSPARAWRRRPTDHRWDVRRNCR